MAHLLPTKVSSKKKIPKSSGLSGAPQSREKKTKTKEQ